MEELRARGLVEQLTHEEPLFAYLESEGPLAYCGFDPTATSLHLGNLVPVMVLAHLQRFGVRPVVLVGGATGRIGDPSGRDTERALQSDEEIERNLQGISRQLRAFLAFEGPAAATMVNNADWTLEVRFIDWLRDVGKFFSVNAMMARESVRRRLQERDQGISYTEFSYMLLQAHDFWHLQQTMDCRLQVGGSDQWGNITAGLDLIHRKGGGQAFGWTCPLLTTANGEKFGKSAGNAVWLDPAKTSPYAFYQYWLRTDDRDVLRWLRAFTFLPLQEIEAMAAQVEEAPEKREAQRRLAAEVTRMVHGDSGLALAERAAAVLFGGTLDGVDAPTLEAIAGDVPCAHLPRPAADSALSLLELWTQSGAVRSRSEARRLMSQGGAYVNNVRVAGPDAALDPGSVLHDRFTLLRSGRKDWLLVVWEPPAC
jgi:tyrosyl-tRNA synthetase